MVASFTSQGTLTPDGLLAGHDDLQTRQITLVAGQNLKRGALLGKITASGKYALSASGASDGSQLPAIVLAEDTDASGADKVTVAYFGGVFDENAITYGAGHTKSSVREALRDVGVKLQSSITR